MGSLSGDQEACEPVGDFWPALTNWAGGSVPGSEKAMLLMPSGPGVPRPCWMPPGSHYGVLGGI